MDRYAVFGNPIGHSQSPFIHRRFAQLTHQIMDYTAILAPLNDFNMSLQKFFAQGGKGCNVTLPFKEQAYHACQWHTERAQAAKAVNTIKQTDTGLLGDNTDGTGLLADITQYVDVGGMHILILGAGGATRGSLLPLIHAKPSSITIANRTVAKATLLCQIFANQPTILRATTLDQLPSHADIIINATSASLQQQHLILPNDVFASTVLAYDLVYGTTLSAFLQQAAQCRVPHIVDGLGMLVHQAAEAFYLWRGIYPDPTSVLAALQHNLTQSTTQ